MILSALLQLQKYAFFATKRKFPEKFLRISRGIYTFAPKLGNYMLSLSIQDK